MSVLLAVVLLGLAGAARGISFTDFAIPTPGAGPSDIVAGSDGNLWFIESYSSKIGRITPGGVITEFAIPTADSDLAGIAAGPDGALWFGEFRGNKIGRITTTGGISEFTVPTADSGPYGIVAGPEGALWFLELYGKKIGRISTSGVIVEFAIPTQSFLGRIAAGPDGNLWFTETNRIGRMTPEGVVTEFELPVTGWGPSGIAAGPDGNVWFTASQRLGNPLLPFYTPTQIGRITPAGVITEFGLPTLLSDPFQIVAGKDGYLWFTETHSNKIGRITTAGIISEFTVPTFGSGPLGIADGPDGNFWFTEVFFNRIGRLSISGACAPSDTNFCLSGGRFQVQTTWTTADGLSGSGHPVSLTPESGYFWFFSPNNVEIMVKVLNGCSVGGSYWVFSAGLTNVRVVLTVADTQTGQVNTYFNELGVAFAPIQDTSAFACP